MKRFISMDPLGFADSMNLYETFGCDPVNNVDPFGLYVYWYYGDNWSNAQKCAIEWCIIALDLALPKITAEIKEYLALSDKDLWDRIYPQSPNPWVHYRKQIDPDTIIEFRLEFSEADLKTAVIPELRKKLISAQQDIEKMNYKVFDSGEWLVFMVSGDITSVNVAEEDPFELMWFGSVHSITFFPDFFKSGDIEFQERNFCHEMWHAATWKPDPQSELDSPFEKSPEQISAFIMERNPETAIKNVATAILSKFKEKYRLAKGVGAPPDTIIEVERRMRIIRR